MESQIATTDRQASSEQIYLYRRPNLETPLDRTLLSAPQAFLYISGVLKLRTPPLVADLGQTRGGFLMKLQNDPKKIRLRRSKKLIFERFRAFPIVATIFKKKAMNCVQRGDPLRFE